MKKKKLIEKYEEIISRLAVENHRYKRKKSSTIMDLIDLKRSVDASHGEVIEKCIEIVRRNFE